MTYVKSSFILCILSLSMCIAGFASTHSRRVHFLKNTLQESHFEDSTKVFEITAEANGFMCPFLTPMFINRLKTEGAIEVSKSQDLIITAVFPQNSHINEESLRKWAASIGYEKDKVHARQK